VDDLRRDRARADGVQCAVVRLADDRIDRPDALHPRHGDQLGHERVGSAPDAEGAGEQDRRLELTQLTHLRRADQLAECVADVDRRRHAIEEEVPAVRQDGGDARVHGVAEHDGLLADEDAGDVGDRIERPGSKDAWCDAELPRACARLLRVECRGARGQRAGSQQRSGDDE
jgi:hypothetical protein